MEEGIANKQSPNISRSQFLENESENSYSFLIEILEKYDITDKNANTIIKLCYDIIMELIRAYMLKEGYNAVGKGAHEAEVSFLRKIDFTENDIRFANQMRYFRNSIMYYGKQMDAEYANNVLIFIKKTRKLLKEKLIQN